MLELAEDEQLDFIERMKEKAISGKTPSDDPTLTVLIGTQGSGKSFLVEKLENTVVVSTDSIVTEYAKTLGIDPRENFYDNDLGVFALKVSGQIIKEAVNNNYNIAFDNSSPATTKVLSKNTPKGYKVDTKVMLVDEYQAALNAIERKMDTDDNYTAYRQGKEENFTKNNIFDVDAVFSLETSNEVVDFIYEAVQKNIPIEVYEFGKEKPSFKTGDDFDKFVSSLEVPSIDAQIKRAENLSKRAKTENEILGLNFLKEKMRREK